MRAITLRCLGGLTVIGILVGAGYARAQRPRVQVRARSQLELNAARSGERIVVRGRLVDDTGTALAGRTVAIAAESSTFSKPGVSVAATTDGSGAFDSSLLVPSGVMHVHGRYAGTEAVDGSESVTDSRAGRVRVLTVEVRGADGEFVDLDAPVHEVRVATAVDGNTANSTLRIRTEQEAVVAEGTIDSDGMWRAEIPASRLGDPGPGELRIYVDDATIADATLKIVRRRRSVVRLEPEAPSSPATVAGHLYDTTGRPLGGEAVDVRINARTVRTVLTAPNGTFAATLDLRSDELQPALLVAEHRSRAPWWIGGRSEPRRIGYSSAAAPPWWALAAMTVGLGVGFIVASGALRRPVVRTKRGPPIDGTLGEVEFGLTERTSRQRSDVVGTVVGAATGTAVASARVSVSDSSGKVAITSCDAHGNFALVDLTPGAFVLAVDAPGHLRATAAGAVPHDGRWRGIVIRLATTRHGADRQYQRAIRAALRGGAPSFTSETARERLAAFCDGPATTLRGIVSSVTERYEQAYYGPEDPPAEQLAALQEMADEVEARAAALARTDV